MPHTTPSTAVTARYHPGTAAGPIVVATTVAGDNTAPIVTTQRLADRLGRNVAAVSVFDLSLAVSAVDHGAYLPDLRPYSGGHREHVRQQLTKVCREGADWPLEVGTGEPASVITDVAHRQRASLIVLGSDRHDVTGRLFGEVALSVIRRATCPVLAVADAPTQVPARVAIVATDFSASSVAAARTALDLLAPGGTLHLVHVWQAHMLLPTAARRAEDEAYERDLPRRFAQVERALRVLALARDVTIIGMALQGDPVDRIFDLARSTGADLIVAGRRGYHVTELLFVGRMTTALLRAAPCAMLVTPEPPPAIHDTLDREATGTSETRWAAEWERLLEGFTRRNADRRARPAIDGPALGAQSQSTGDAFVGATYDLHDHRVSPMRDGGTNRRP